MPHDDGMNAKDRNCPHCGSVRFIDPVDSLYPFKCANTECRQESSYGAWCNSSNSLNTYAIAGTTSDAFTQEILKHTAAYTTDADGGGVASGTVIQIGEQLFVATVAHTLTGDNSHIGLVGKDRATRGCRSRWVMRQSIHPEGNIDVGLIELDPEVIADLGFAPITLARVVDSESGNPVLKTRIIGSPWESKLDDVIQKGVRVFRSLSYGCETVHPLGWHPIYTDNLDPELHLLAHYEPEDNIDWNGDFVVPTKIPKPHGMSGGGYWQRPEWLPDDQIWQPTDLCLCGIQSTFMRKYSVVKGVQIIHWLSLVAHRYPELRGEIEQRFPRIAHL